MEHSRWSKRGAPSILKVCRVSSHKTKVWHQQVFEWSHGGHVTGKRSVREIQSVLVTSDGGDRSISHASGNNNIRGWGNGGRESGVLDHGPNYGNNDLEGEKKGRGRGGNNLWVRNSFIDGWIVPLGDVSGPQRDG